MNTAVVQQSAREIGKADRRRRIVDAADALVHESGFDSVSMVQIAQRAELSPATLYNLFETKEAILREVLNRDLDAFKDLVANERSENALERIFVAINVSVARFRSDPVFYRAIGRATESANKLAKEIRVPRRTFWRDQVAAALAEGRLRPNTDVDLLGVTLWRLIRGAFIDWIADMITAERMAKEITYGMALALLPHATEENVPAVMARLRASETAWG